MLVTLPALAASLITAPPAREPLKLGAYPQLQSTQYTTRDGLTGGAAKRIRIVNGRVHVLTDAGPLVRDGERWAKGDAAVFAPPTGFVVWHMPPGATVIDAAYTRTRDVWMVTTVGAFKQVTGKTEPLELPRAYKYNQPMVSNEIEIRSLMADRSGHIWLATNVGAVVTDGKDWWRHLDRADGMPYEDLHCLAIAPNGDLWGGTREGAWRLRAGQWRYFWGRRWMPGNHVSGIACADDGSVWIATDRGVARISERAMRLSEKAEHYEKITAARHNRRGWVTSCTLDDAENPEKGFTHEASDNDGLWTSIYVGAESYRYAATHDPAARALAKKSMDAMLDMVRLSGVPGFPARAIIEKGEKVSGYNADETVRVAGETEKIWYTNPKQPNLLIKGDTSSDELDGHYFAWYTYYTLVADEAEKKEIRAVVKAVTDNMVQHELTLFGHTGRKTRWGVFGPRWLNDDPFWQSERGINSLAILCYLKIAHAICGDASYELVYEDLIKNHHYLINLLEHRRHEPWYQINHSDDEMIYLDFLSLLQLEQRPERRTIVLEAIAESWRTIKPERGPFYNFIYGAATGASCAVEDAVETLQDWPLDLRHWATRNSHRTDVNRRVGPGPQRLEIDRVLPASERRPFRWNGNPWQPDSGGNGTDEEDGAAWLLPYWMGRYYGFIAE